MILFIYVLKIFHRIVTVWINHRGEILGLNGHLFAFAVRSSSVFPPSDLVIMGVTWGSQSPCRPTRVYLHMLPISTSDREREKDGGKVWAIMLTGPAERPFRPSDDMQQARAPKLLLDDLGHGTGESAHQSQKDEDDRRYLTYLASQHGGKHGLGTQKSKLSQF